MGRSLPSFFPWALLAAGMFAEPPRIAAGDPASLVKKIHLAGENKETAARLAAADRLVEPAFSADNLAAIVGLAAAPWPDPVATASAFSLELISQQKWTEAVEEYQRIIYDEGDNLVLASDDSPGAPTARSVPARRLCHQRIAAVPVSVLELHQKRVHILAEKLFQQGQESRERGPLRRLANDLLCSRLGGRAVELLGDLAFEKGDFAEALHWWRLLALPASAANERRPDFVVPDPGLEPARVCAKQIIAVAFQGETDRAKAELKAYQVLYGEARGQLGGRQGSYAAVVHDLISKAPAGNFADDSWPTFAGSPTRNRVLVKSPSPRLWEDGPAWQAPLAGRPSPEAEPATAGRQTRRPAFHPLIVEDKVLLAGPRSVTGYHLLTGQVLFHYDLVEAGKAIGPKGVTPRLAAEARFTVTVSGDRIFARLGEGSLGPGKSAAKEKSYLVCLDMKAGLSKKGAPLNRKAGTVRELWQVAAPVEAPFEGAPLVHEGRVYIAQSQVVGNRTKTSLACYDAVSGAPRWLQEICDTPEFADHPGQRRRQHLLTLAATQVVYCSHSGAIVALDRETGQRAWGVRYPNRGPQTANGLPSPRELCPCVESNGRLFCAPLDCDRIFCLEASSGQTQWERDGIEVVQLMGVAGGRLIFTTPRGLRAVAAASGMDEGGWLQPSEGKLPGLGRGLLAGPWVFWPTMDRKLPLRAVTQKDGDQELLDREGNPLGAVDPTQLRAIPSGNLVFGNGCLVVATSDELVVFVPPERLLKKLQAEAAEPGAAAAAFYLLARAEAGAGLFAKALEHFARAARDQTEQNFLVRSRALAERYVLLLDLAGRAENQAAQKLSRAWEIAAGYVRQAGGAEFPAHLRLRAYTRLTDLWLRAGQPQRAAAAWQAILSDETLRQGTIRTSDGALEEAGPFAARRIQELMQKYGSAVYGPFENEAKVRLAQVKGNVTELERLVREYPNAGNIPAALEQLALLQKKGNRPGAAADAYRQLLGRTKGAGQVPALAGLARSSNDAGRPHELPGWRWRKTMATGLLKNAWFRTWSPSSCGRTNISRWRPTSKRPGRNPCRRRWPAPGWYPTAS